MRQSKTIKQRKQLFVKEKTTTNHDEINVYNPEL